MEAPVKTRGAPSGKRKETRFLSFFLWPGKSRARAGLIIGLWLLGGCAGAGKFSGELDQLLAEATAADVTAIHIAEIHADRIVTHNAGVASLTTRAPIRDDSRIRIASLGKLYISALAASYVLDEKLDLDEQIAPWLRHSGLFGDPLSARVTWRMLLDQTSGFENYTDLPGWRRKKFGEAPQQGWSVEQVYRLLRPYPLRFVPGSRWSYSNSNTLLFADGLETRAGYSLERQLEERVFRPAKITGTHLDNGDYNADWVHGYLGATPKRDTLRWRHALYDAGLTSSLSELARFLRFLYFDAHPIARFLREHWTACRQEKNTAEGGVYCLGMNRQQTGAGSAYFHIEGNWPGYHTSSLFFPESGRAVLIFTATTSGRADSWHEKLEDFYLGKEAVRAGDKPGNYGQSP